MQSMFRLAWSTEGDKIMEKAALHKSRPLPVVELPSLMSKLKRKRTDSPEPATSQPVHVVKKWKSATGEVKPAMVVNGSAERLVVVDGVVPTEVSRPAEAVDPPKVASAEVLDSRPKAQPSRKEGASKSKVSRVQQSSVKPEPSSPTNPVIAMETSLTKVQQAIEAQINIEIMLKHNELRLIEQELAKCQVSLEQLRRCSIIPFPGTQGCSVDVSGGVGPALQPLSGYTKPQHPAPWGVLDGPYTRHYAKWLISDPKFDPITERALAQQSHGYFGVGEGRMTRHSFADFGSNSKARTSRTSTGTLKLPALGETPAPAPKVDPLLHKRSTDGQWVRLYCAPCAHSNFSNTQGFLNHCRIKHNQVFKSHDQAAIACGIPVDAEAGTPVSATEPTSAQALTPAVTFPVSTASGFVHPLVRANPAQPAKDVHRDFSRPARDEVKPQVVAESQISFSPSTPYMSALLKNRGFNGDFKQMVETARTKVDLNAMETWDDDINDNTVVQTPVIGNPQLIRLPASAPTANSANDTPSARPGSKNNSHGSGHARLPLSFPAPVNVAASLSGRNGGRLPESPVDLSPHTVESNPGLVSDHDDDDDDEDAEDARSQPDVIMGEHDGIVVEDASDVEGVERSGSRKGLGGCFEKGEASRKH
ncbi:hypothetical protein BDV95DRAFT_380476 [Massariosphaeria phaeospora]|uniref:AHC1-like C2H2 zinc-finger domain-containing protein n=1 Tax=Massariosphaeria phaeospora TaxID=100035 RepID=A0A7C8I708_9PLEO|nr:hypothetical protein BDV95DRAFT_380476 [Massariosphaeria phaeospora]